MSCCVSFLLVEIILVFFSATEAAERQTETVSEEDQPAAGEGETFSQTAAEGWQERVSFLTDV